MDFDSMIQNPGAYPDMDYLVSEAAQSRCVMAAHFVRECPQVIEVGGFKTPVSLFLTGSHEAVTVIDPLMREYHSGTLNGRPCEVRHIPSTFQAADIELTEEYGFVMLGASLKYFSDDEQQHVREWKKLTALITGARVAVIEAAVEWSLGNGILEQILQLPYIEVRVDIELNLSANPGMDAQHFRRRLLVLSCSKQ